MYTYEFSVLDDPYFPEKDYVFVTTISDEDMMEKFTDLFYTHNKGIYSYEHGFIIPQKTFNNVLKPLLDKFFKENIIHDWEGGED